MILNKATIYIALLAAFPAFVANAQDTNGKPTEYDGYKLVWCDEFNKDGKPDESNWDYEHGLVRNKEDQFYQAQNAFCENGKLIIEGRKERVKNPKFDPEKAQIWPNLEYAEYTSACLTTNKKHSWTFGRFEVRAKIPTYPGCWPAIWLLGQDYLKDNKYEWPNNGEIDVMEYYQIGGKPHILANACWGSATAKYDAHWNSAKILYNDIAKGDQDWGNKFHVWRMDWDENDIKIYLDGRLLNDIPLSSTVNPQTSFFDEKGYNPFKRPQYLLLNLALGGINGGSLDSTPFPCRYEIDYVRVYQKTNENN